MQKIEQTEHQTLAEKVCSSVKSFQRL